MGFGTQSHSASRLLDQLYYVNELPNEPIFKLLFSLYFLTPVKTVTQTFAFIHMHTNTQTYTNTHMQACNTCQGTCSERASQILGLVLLKCGDSRG